MALSLFAYQLSMFAKIKLVLLCFGLCCCGTTYGHAVTRKATGHISRPTTDSQQTYYRVVCLIFVLTATIGGILLCLHCCNCDDDLTEEKKKKQAPLPANTVKPILSQKLQQVSCQTPSVTVIANVSLMSDHPSVVPKLPLNETSNKGDISQLAPSSNVAANSNLLPSAPSKCAQYSSLLPSPTKKVHSYELSSCALGNTGVVPSTVPQKIPP